MANEKNLIPNSKRTPEELRAMTQKGGRASVVARRKKAKLAALAEKMLSLPCVDEVELQEAGFDTPDLNNGARIVCAMVNEAAKGNVQAAKYISDLVGEGAAFDLKKQELKIKKAAVKAAETQRENTSSAMLQLVETLREAE